MNKKWATSAGFVYAAAGEVIEILDMHGSKIDEWGPYESDILITSLAANELYVN